MAGVCRYDTEYQQSLGLFPLPEEGYRYQPGAYDKAVQLIPDFSAASLNSLIEKMFSRPPEHVDADRQLRRRCLAIHSNHDLFIPAGFPVPRQIATFIPCARFYLSFSTFCWRILMFEPAEALSLRYTVRYRRQ